MAKLSLRSRYCARCDFFIHLTDIIKIVYNLKILDTDNCYTILAVAVRPPIVDAPKSDGLFHR